MKIAILGAGALGCYYGARLLASHQDVSFIMRSDYEYVRDHGLQLSSIDGDLELPRVKVFRDTSTVGICDLVILTWKTTANDQLASALPPLLGDNTIVLTLQNGMGNAEALSAFLPQNRIYVGLCGVCAMRNAPGQISHLDGGNIQIAPFIPSPEGTTMANKLAELFQQAKISSKGFDFAEQIQWFKLVWNIPYNGLCLAYGGISVGELYKNPKNIVRVKKIMEDVVRAAQARGYTLPDTLIDFHLERTKVMKEFTPSSAVDYNKGRPIEYHAIWGDPLTKARSAGANIPEWEKLDQEIRQRIGLPD
ncbi:MAG: 2-dehydropantoate 2-reductase [Akkermansia sp.]